MNRDSERRVVGGCDGRDNITYCEGRWGRLIGETKYGVLESQWFCVQNLTHFIEALHNFFGTTADGDFIRHLPEISDMVTYSQNMPSTCRSTVCCPRATSFAFNVISTGSTLTTDASNPAHSMTS